MPIPILSISGFDPTGGAGVLRDAAVFKLLGLEPYAVLTSVAAQGRARVAAIRPLGGKFVRQELQIILAECEPAAVKIGMVYSPTVVREVAAFIRRIKAPAVLDPVLKASSGGDLIQPTAAALLESELIPRCCLITPNSLEAAYFLQRPLRNAAEAAAGAQELAHKWGTAVLLKGGHLSCDPVDFLAFGEACWEYPHQRIAGAQQVRGTGCVLASAIAAGLAQGKELREAVEFGVNFMQEEILHLLPSVPAVI